VMHGQNSSGEWAEDMSLHTQKTKEREGRDERVARDSSEAKGAAFITGHRIGQELDMANF